MKNYGIILRNRITNDFVNRINFFFMSEGIPAWIQNISSKSSTMWNFGIVSMSAMTIIIYLSKR